MEKKRIVVDCDAGIDDALALVILSAAHKLNKIQLLGITCVNGNTVIDNVVNNVFRTLQTCGTEDIPVYKGAYSPLLSLENTDITAAELYHGRDGFGDTFTDNPDISKLQKEHAVYALNKIVSENPGQITVVCLGPLTNIALAIKMNPHFINDVKEFFTMGGNYTAQGNITSQAEFNFYADPESVHVLLANNKKPHFLLPWETCLRSTIDVKWRTEVFGKIESPQVRFINAIEHNTSCAEEKRPDFNYNPCDAFVAAIIVQPDIAKKVVQHHADIELFGLRTRGQVVIDHLKTKEPNIDIITDFDSEIFKELLIFLCKP